MKNRGVKWLLVSLTWFLSITILGLLMRYFFVGNLEGVNYKYMLHGHSHVALLGWVYTAIFVGVIEIFLKKNYTEFRWVYYLTQVTIIGMFVSFPIQGYAFFSITFSTLFLFASYWFVWKVFKQLNSTDRNLASTKFLKASLWYLVISSIGPWSLGPLMVSGFAHKPIYFNTIYFFLHFLYNGFIVMAIMAFIYKWIEIKMKSYIHHGKQSFLWLNISIVPSYLLSTYWTYDNTYVHLVGGLSILFLLVSFLYFIIDARALLKTFISNKWIFYLLLISIFSYVLKVAMMSVSGLPILAEFIYQNGKYLIIGYLHLVFLGFVSLFMLVWFRIRGMISFKGVVNKIGLLMYVIGVVLSEFLLFYQGSGNWIGLPLIEGFYNYLFVVSALMPLGVLMFFIGQIFCFQTIKQKEMHT